MGFQPHERINMKKPLIYLDNCCFNRPYDDQIQMKVYLGTQAKIHIQAGIIAVKYGLVWSYMLEYENDANPQINRQREIASWRTRAALIVRESPEIVEYAATLQRSGIQTKDALHLACAVSVNADYFMTTDAKLLKKATVLEKITVMNPLEFVAHEGGNGHEN